MKKNAFCLLIVVVCAACSLKFDPAGRLAHPTVTPSVVPMLKHTAVVVTTTCTVTGDLNLRAEPSINAQVIDWLLTGESVVAGSEETDGWRMVRNWAGTSGFVSARWLRCGGE